MLRNLFGVARALTRPTTYPLVALPAIHIRPHLNVKSYSSSSVESFLSGPSASYIDEMYSAWLVDPKSVHVSWQIYFKNIARSSATSQAAFIPPPTIVPGAESLVTSVNLMTPDHVFGLTGAVPSPEVLDHMKVQLMVRAYQVRGHQLAKLDPLGISERTGQDAPELDYKYYGFTDADLDRKFYLGSGILPQFITQEGTKEMTLREIVDRLKNTYCGSIGVEYGHILDRGMCDWLRSKFETPVKYKYSKKQKLKILDRLLWSDHFERFVAAKYPSEKRFGLEGCESLIPGMKAMIDNSVEQGVDSIVMGMPHRGRLNVLSNVVRKPNESIFSEFSGSQDTMVEGSGDVKYHLGMNYARPTPSGRMVHLSLVANPSHLEAVDPVVEGKTRAIQFYQNDEAEHSKAMAVLLHGDAAFSGQGVVYETLGMSDLPAYATGGSIHIIVNNQVGFTTDPRFSRSTLYCSDVAKTVEAPVLHVNGDDVEAVVYCMELASEWRAKFKKDVVIDIVCYRKYGHNEIDQPGFTQPLMYQNISKMTPVVEKYIQQLLSEGQATQEEVDGMKKEIWKILEKNYEDSKTYKSSSKEWVASAWPGFKSPAELSVTACDSKTTGVATDVLRHIGLTSSTYPSKDFVVHPVLAKILKTREKAINEGEGIDWATAEAMAFGSLLSEGIHVRLSGQDVERGTFSQRHAVLHDQNTESEFIPLNNLVVASGVVPSQAHFSVCNSSLSEFGTLGFELGYSMVNPNQLVLWEAQFGDFANNAQCIIDQYISSGEQKWLQRSGLTMLLPHGYDGQGPEHSSARMERFLQLVDEDPYHMPEKETAHRDSYARQHQDCNMQVVYATVPSNYFHVLRRQVHREFRKPLIVFTSKALLRHPLAKSSLAEMTENTRFQRVIPEVLHPSPLEPLSSEKDSVLANNTLEPRLPYGLISPQNPPSISATAQGTIKVNPGTLLGNSTFQLAAPNKITTLIFCSGQVYYHLFRTREVNNLNHIALVRIEQLCPFPFWEIQKVVDFYGESLNEVVFAQEESMNSGAWQHVEPRLHTAIRESEWYKSGKGKDWQAALEEKRYGGGLENYRLDYRQPLSWRGGLTVRYAGRDQSAAPATGIKKQHKYEDSMLLSEAFFGGRLMKPVDYVNGIPKFE